MSFSARSIRRLSVVVAIAVTSTLCCSMAQAQAVAVATGDSRTVTEPSFPALCSTQPPLLASFHDVNDDVPAATESLGTEIDQARIQAALNACANTTGTSVAVELSMDGSGNNAFLTGPLTMPNGVTLLIDAGVTLYFSRNAQDYDATPGTHTCGTVSTASNTSSCKNLISFSTVSNAGIMGYGKMNARGGDVVLNSFSTAGSPTLPANASWWDIANAISGSSSQQNPRWIQMKNSNNITLYKITLKNAPNFHIATSGGNGITFWGIKIITPYTAHNTDGIDPSNGTNITITHVSGSDGDDNVAVGATNASTPMTNISVTHNRFFAGHGESIGSITQGGASNILFDSNTNYGDADVDGSNSTAIRIKSADDRGGAVHNVQYSNSCFANHGTQIQFDTLYDTTAGALTPNFNTILLQNLRFASGITSPATASPVATGSVAIQGASNNGTVNPITVTLDNVTMDSAPTLSSPDSQSDIFQAQITLGPGAVSSTLSTPLLAASGSNGNVVTNNSAGSLSAPACTFTFLTPEITGPTAQSATLTLGQLPIAVVILSPTEALANLPYPTGTVTVTDELSHSFTATLSGTSDTVFVPITTAPLGTHTYSASYSGNSVYPAITSANFGSTYTVTVNAGTLTSTGLGLTGVPANTSFGTAFTATATLTGTGTPTGSITFVVNGAVYATVPISSKAASFQFNLPLGAYTITANYAGDSANSGAVSTTSNLTVAAAATTTALATSSSTGVVGTPVTLTATVSSAGGTPTGSVALTYTNALVTTPTSLGSVTLVNGVGTFNTLLPQGTDSLVATYTASGNFGSSASTNPITVTVSAAPPVPDATLPLAMPYNITTIAGGGAALASGTFCSGTSGPKTTDAVGDGCLGTQVAIPGGTSVDLRSVAADPFGNVYFSDGNNEVIHKIAPNGMMTAFAGLGAGTACTISASQACSPTVIKFTGKPRGVSTDAFGNVFIAGNTQHQVWEVRASDGLMHLIAGTGTITPTPGSPQDGIAATATTLDGPRAVASDGAGNIYIADTTNNRIREVNALSGIIQTVAGTGASTGNPAVGTPTANVAATAATLSTAQGLAIDTSNNIYIAESGHVDAVCVACSSATPLTGLSQLLTNLGYTNIQNGNIYIVAGGGTGKTPGLANTVTLAAQRVAIDPNGNLYISDGDTSTTGVGDGLIWFEDGRTGFIRIIAGNTAATAPSSGATCTGGTATDAIGDGCAGTQAIMGDFIATATSANGFGVGIDTQGNVYISDTLDASIRKLSNNKNFGSGPTGTAISKTIDIHYQPGDTPTATTLTSSEFTLGTGNCSSNGDTTEDCLYTASFTPAVAGPRVAPLSITTANGNPGVLGLSGSGAGAGATIDPANQLNFGQGISPNAITVDSAGNVYVADATSGNVLKYAKSAIAGGATAANTVLKNFTNPSALATDSLGDLFVADASTGVVTEITAAGTSSALSTSFNAPVGLAVDSLNNLYIADSVAKTVTELGSNLVSPRIIANTGLATPAGLAVDANNNLYLADSGAGAIYRFDAATQARTTASTAAIAPKAVAVDAAGNLLIADAGTNQILAVPEAVPASVITVADASLAIPANSLALDSAGNVYTNSGANQVLELLRTQGAATYNGAGAAPSTFSLLSTGNTAASLSLTDPDTTDFSLSLGSSTGCTGPASALAVAVGASCTFTSTFTPAATHNYVNTATFSGNAVNALLASPAMLEIVQSGNNTPFSTTLTLNAATPASPTFGSSATLNATVSSSSGTPAGTVTFSVDGTAITPASPVTVATGAASATAPATLTAGNHTITAAFTSSAPGAFTNSTATQTTLTVQQATPGALLSVLHTSYNFNTANSATFTLTPVAGTATGTVQFSIDGSASGSPVTVSANAATFTLPSLSVAQHTITAVYSGDSNFLSVNSGSGITVTVTQLITPVTTYPAQASIVYGTTLVNNLNATTASGGTSLTSGGTTTYSATANGTTAAVPVTTSTVLGPGTYTLTALWTPNSTNAATYSNGGASTPLVVNKRATTGVVAQTAPLPTTGGAGAGVSTTFTATVADSSTAPAVSAIPTGQVQFFNGSTALGSPVTLVNGVATLTTTFSTVQTASITAQYAGDANYLTSTSPALSESVVTPGFTASAAPSTITITRGSTGSSTLTFTPFGNYQGTLSLACSGLPTGATCQFTPSTITFTGNNAVQTSQLLVSTTNVSSVPGGSSSGLLWIPAGLLACFVAIRRRRLSLRPLLLIAMAAFAIAAMTGCGGGASASAAPPAPVTTTATVTASATGTGGSANSTQNVTITIIIQ